jgi:low affinity Fe/Cu permease
VTKQPALKNQRLNIRITAATKKRLNTVVRARRRTENEYLTATMVIEELIDEEYERCKTAYKR